MAASWPTSVATDSNLYIAVNELQNALSSGIDNAVTTIGLNSVTNFPTVGLILIDNEVIQYTGISGLNLTGCTRAFDGTTAASHSASAVVSFAIMAAHHNVLKDEVKAIETYLSNNLGTGSQPLATGSRVLVSSAGGKISESSVTTTTLGFLDATSSIQTQLNAKAPTASPTFTGTVTTAGIAMASNKITGLANGTASTDAATFGQIFAGFQTFVQATSVTQSSTTSATYQSSNLTASITPTSSSHRVKVTVSWGYQLSNAGGSTIGLALFRGTTQLSGSSDMIVSNNPAASILKQGFSITYIDSPATTSATTYTLKFRSVDGSTVKTPSDNLEQGSIILEEIA